MGYEGKIEEFQGPDDRLYTISYEFSYSGGDQLDLDGFWVEDEKGNEIDIHDSFYLKKIEDKIKEDLDYEFDENNLHFKEEYKLSREDYYYDLQRKEDRLEE